MSADEAEQIRLAVNYQLLTERTNFIVVAERLEKAENLPTLQQVPQMMAAGWGGAGIDSAAIPDVSFQVNIPAVCRKTSISMSDALARSGVDRYDVPAYLRRENRAVSESLKSNTATATEPQTPLAFIQFLNGLLAGVVNGQALPSTFEVLRDYGLPAEMVDALAAFVSPSNSEQSVVLAFLHALAEGPLASHFERDLKRLVVSQRKRQADDPLLYQRCKACLSRVEQEAWNWVEDVGLNTIVANT